MLIMVPQDETLELDSSLLPNSYNTSPREGKHIRFLMLALKLFLSISVLSFLVSFCTGLSFLQHVSTFRLFPLLTETFERKYMFILCNTILVFLAGKSGICCTFSDTTHSQLQLLQLEDAEITNVSKYDRDIVLHSAESSYTVPAVMEEQESALAETEDVEMEEEQAGDKYYDEHLAPDESEEVAGAAYFKVKEEDNESELILIEENEESETNEIEGDEDDHETMQVDEGCGKNDTERVGLASNTEELNKKIEEFIRKMKEELRLEAQQQQIIAA